MISNYVTGDFNQINGEFMQEIYTICPNIAKPSTGEVYFHNGKIIVASKWTEQIIATFETEQEFFESCDEVSGPPNPHNYNGWD